MEGGTAAGGATGAEDGEDGARRLATGADGAAAVPGAAVLGDRRDADQAGDERGQLRSIVARVTRAIAN
jgi:hypothetical protein